MVVWRGVKVGWLVERWSCGGELRLAGWLRGGVLCLKWHEDAGWVKIEELMCV